MQPKPKFQNFILPAVVGVSVTLCIVYLHNKTPISDTKRKQVAESAYHDHILNTYGNTLIQYQFKNPDDTYSELTFNSYNNPKVLEKQVEECGALIKATNADIEIPQKEDLWIPIHARYKLKENSKIDTQPFIKCITKQLAQTELSPTIIKLLSTSPQYKAIKDLSIKEFDYKISEIKKNGKFTSLDGYELIRIIDSYVIYNKYTDKVIIKGDMESAINSL